jgi:hypothetical protein
MAACTNWTSSVNKDLYPAPHTVSMKFKGWKRRCINVLCYTTTQLYIWNDKDSRHLSLLSCYFCPDSHELFYPPYRGQKQSAENTIICPIFHSPVISPTCTPVKQPAITATALAHVYKQGYSGPHIQFWRKMTLCFLMGRKALVKEKRAKTPLLAWLWHKGRRESAAELG